MRTKSHHLKVNNETHSNQRPGNHQTVNIPIYQHQVEIPTTAENYFIGKFAKKSREERP